MPANNKTCAPKLIFFNEKKKEKDSDDFWCRKFTLKVKFWHFLTPPHYTNLQNSMISFDYTWFLAKNLSNFVSFPLKLHNRYCHSQQIPFLQFPAVSCIVLPRKMLDISMWVVVLLYLLPNALGKGYNGKTFLVN